MNNRIEKRIELKAPQSRVWRAITDHREFGTWFHVNLAAPFTAGREALGQITHPGFEHVRWRAVIQRIEPETLFSFTWHPYAIEPNVDYSHETPTLVEFRLSPTATGTLLVVTETGFDHVPAARRDEAFRKNDGGWAAQMKNIEAHVARPA
ncbi:MAG TPA: SRPBCC family protein [Steroidobacteraceae bacterium]|nr:SRPBCC family protein [Steroidobacteraceae bacterium]